VKWALFVAGITATLYASQVRQPLTTADFPLFYPRGRDREPVACNRRRRQEQPIDDDQVPQPERDPEDRPHEGQS
jgi:hypothetical protein